MVGNAKDAAHALAQTSTGWHEDVYSYRGTTRMVYLINGVIYKVNIDHSADWNVLEYEQARTLRPLLPQGVFIPEVSLFEIDGNSVIAMEFIDGDISGECDGMFDDEPCACDSPCMPDDLLTELRSIGWDDNTMGNAVCCDGVYYLIDLGC